MYQFTSFLIRNFNIVYIRKRNQGRNIAIRLQLTAIVVSKCRAIKGPFPISRQRHIFTLIEFPILLGGTKWQMRFLKSYCKKERLIRLIFSEEFHRTIRYRTICIGIIRNGCTLHRRFHIFLNVFLNQVLLLQTLFLGFLAVFIVELPRLFILIMRHDGFFIFLIQIFLIIHKRL